jgi:uncharacterized membrane protein YdbT with pleckstrin-like domain
MAYPKKLLGPNEEVVIDTHPHWKVLVVSTLEMLLVLVVAGFLLAYFDAGWERLTVTGSGLLLVLLVFGVPFLRWRTTHIVITNKRVVTRSGILRRHGRDVPLTRVNDVSFTEGIIERLLRAGTLTVESAGERGQVVLHDVPHVAEVQRTLYELAEKADREAHSS